MNEDENYIPETSPEEALVANESYPGDITPSEEDTVAQQTPPQVIINRKPPKKGMMIAAFILFALTLVAFGFFEFFSITMLYMPLANGADNVGEAIGLIFLFAFGIIFALGLGIVQLVLNIPTIALFSTLTARADTPKKRALFIVFLVLSCLLLIAMAATLIIFFVGTGGSVG